LNAADLALIAAAPTACSMFRAYGSAFMRRLPTPSCDPRYA
jgi:hypothetical protein